MNSLCNEFVFMYHSFDDLYIRVCGLKFKIKMDIAICGYVNIYNVRGHK